MAVNKLFENVFVKSHTAVIMWFDLIGFPKHFQLYLILILKTNKNQTQINKQKKPTQYSNKQNNNKGRTGLQAYLLPETISKLLLNFPDLTLA